MRNYLYCWNDPARRLLVASGFEFRDFEDVLGPRRSILLLRHEYDDPRHDRASRFDFAPVPALAHLPEGTTYGWGDLCWADFGGSKPPKMTPLEIASLLYFAHEALPLRSARVRSLGNLFLCWAHDDGWFLRIAYRSWHNVARLLLPPVRAVGGQGEAFRTVETIRKGRTALWITRGVVTECRKTLDVDSILDKHQPQSLRKPWKAWSRIVQ